MMTLPNLLLLQAPAPDNGFMPWIMIICMFAVMYFFMIRPQRKKQKEIDSFRKQLQVNQSVVTAGGIYGVIKEINDNDVLLEVDRNVRIRVDKNSIFADASSASYAGQQPAKN